MRLTSERDNVERTTRIVFEVNDSELADLRLDELDLALLREPEDSAADVLLKAEMIARRLQEQRPSLNT